MTAAGDDREQPRRLRPLPADPERRGALMREAQAIAVRDVALIPLRCQANAWALRAGLTMVGRPDERTEAALVRPA